VRVVTWLQWRILQQVLCRRPCRPCWWTHWFRMERRYNINCWNIWIIHFTSIACYIKAFHNINRFWLTSRQSWYDWMTWLSSGLTAWWVHCSHEVGHSALGQRRINLITFSVRPTINWTCMFYLNLLFNSNVLKVINFLPKGHGTIYPQLLPPLYTLPCLQSSMNILEYYLIKEKFSLFWSKLIWLTKQLTVLMCGNIWNHNNTALTCLAQMSSTLLIRQ